MKRASVLAFLLLTSALAQQTGITGRVSDQSGGILPLTVVRITDTASGRSQSTVSSETGVFGFPSLPASEYRLRAEAPGFTPVEKTLTILVGQVIEADLTLRPSAVSSTVDVQAEIASIETTSSQVAGNIDPRQMKEVPLNGRNWMELALLVPGITRNAVGDTPIGNDSGKIQINVDGQQVTQNTAGTGSQQAYSREAISEFQIITNRFDATLGRSARLQINAQTKSGSNALHGSLYGYFRNDSLNAADKVARRVLPYQNQQFGGTFGGPLLKDRLWFFGAYEAEREPGTLFLTPTGFTGQDFSFASQTDSRTILTRIDFQRSDSSRYSLRLSASAWKNPFTNVGGTAHPSRATDSTRSSLSAVGGWNKTLSPTLVSDMKLGFSYHNWTNDPLVQSQEYRLGVTTVGAPYNYPGDRFQNSIQARNDLYWMKGKHSVKFGGEYINTRHYGFFQQNVRGVVTSFSRAPADLNAVFPVWNDPSSWKLDVLGQTSNSFVQGFGDFNLNIRRNTFGFWMQDDWKINPRLTLNLGLRYDNDIGMLGNSPKLKSGLLLPEGSDANNIAPRLGFAFDVTGQRRTVIRGGIGLYYADMIANMFYNQQLFNGETTVQAAVDAKPGAPISLTQPFGQYTGEDFLTGNAPAPQQSLQLVNPDVVTPYSYQMSLGIEKAIASDWTVIADFVNWRLYHEWSRVDENLFYNPATGFNRTPSAGRPDARYTSVLRFITPSVSGAIYTGFQLEVRKRFSKGLTLASSYTLARLKDSSGGAFSVPNNPFNLADEWGNGGDDQRHTFNVNGSFSWKWGLQLSGLYRYGSGSVFSTTASGSPFANGGTNRTFLATTRTYNDPKFNKPAPYAAGYLITERNQLYGLPIHRVDVRGTKTFSLGERFRVQAILEAFNLFNRANYGTFATAVTSANFGAPGQNSNLAYSPRMLQIAGRFEF